MTGYVSEAIREKMNAKEFFLLCSKAFLGYYRDRSISDPIPDKIEPNTFYQDELKKSEAELKKLLKIKDNKKKIVAWAEKEISSLISCQEKYIEENENENKIITSILKEINKLKIDPEFNNIKSFCIRQLSDSINDVSYSKSLLDENRTMDKISFYENQIVKIKDRINSCKKNIKEEQELTDKTNLWLEKLKKQVL